MEKEKGHRTVDVFSYAYGNGGFEKVKAAVFNRWLSCLHFFQSSSIKLCWYSQGFFWRVCQSVPLHKLLHLLKPYLQKPVLILI